LIKFTAISVVRIFIGIFFLRKISGEKLKTSFGWFVLLMGFYILAKELINFINRKYDVSEIFSGK
jgi:uncharacterized membrane protein YfcA